MSRILIRILFGAILVLPAAAQKITLPQAKGSVRFAVIGDSGSGERLQYETADRLRLAHQQFPFEFALMLETTFTAAKHRGTSRESLSCHTNRSWTTR